MFETGVRKVMVLKTVDGFSAKLTPEHLVWVSRDDGQTFQWMETRNIQPGNLVRLCDRPMDFSFSQFRQLEYSRGIVYALQLSCNIVTTPDDFTGFVIDAIDCPLHIRYIRDILTDLFTELTVTVVERMVGGRTLLLVGSRGLRTCLNRPGPRYSHEMTQSSDDICNFVYRASCSLKLGFACGMLAYRLHNLNYQECRLEMTDMPDNVSKTL